MMELPQLKQRHAQEQHSQAQEQLQAQELLQQHQQQEFQEQQNTFFRLQQEQQHQPTIQREHEMLMLQQACALAEKMYLQQQQHLLHTQQQDRERMQERHWHEEQLLIQQLQHFEQQQQHQQQEQQEQHQQQYHNGHPQYQQQQPHPFQQIQHQGHSPHQQQHSTFIHSPQLRHGDPTQQHGAQPTPLSNTQHQPQHHHQQQQNSPQHTLPGVLIQHQPQHQPFQNQNHHTPQRPESSNPEDAMDIDDEIQINTITSTISNLRHSMPVDIDSVSSWASGSGDTNSRDDGDPHAIVILDTNVLISHLNFIQSLIVAHGTSISDAKKSSSRPSSPQEPQIIFIIPWVVVRELDGLKGNRNHGGGGEVDLGEKARRAIRYIHEEMEKPADKRKLRGQKISECMEKQDQNDDYILDCCRYFKTAYPDDQRTRVNLFSNDRNLCVKALIHEIETISRDKVNLEVKTVLAAILGQQQTKKEEPCPVADAMMLDGNDDEDMTGSKPSSPAAKPILSRSSSSGISIISGSSRGTYRTEVNERELQRIKSGPKTTEIPRGMDPELFNLTSHVIRNLRVYFEFAVPDHLGAIYGSDWKIMTDYDRTMVKGEDLAYDCKRLAQPIHLVLKNWALFSDLYGSSGRASKAKNHMTQVQLFVKTWDRVETFGLGKVYKKDLVAFLNDVDAVLAGIMTKPANNNRSSSQPSSSSAMDKDTAKYYDASSRIQLMKNWKAHCNALAD